MLVSQTIAIFTVTFMLYIYNLEPVLQSSTESNLVNIFLTVLTPKVKISKFKFRHEFISNS